MKEEEPDELKPQKRERDLHSDHLFEVSAFQGSRPNGTAQQMMETMEEEQENGGWKEEMQAKGTKHPLGVKSTGVES